MAGSVSGAGPGAGAGSAGCARCSLCRVWWKAIKWLPVLLIVTIIGWSYYAYVVQLCLVTVESGVEKALYLVFYHILLFMFVWSYWRTVFAEIEPIPDKFKLPQSETEKLLAAETEDAQRLILDHFAYDLPIVTRSEKGLLQTLLGKVWSPNLFPWECEPWTMSGAIRYCNRCVQVKPDRSHHCSMCGTCVLKMDHHCPWVNNCVCFHNYKFFMLFLGYALCYCAFIMCTALQYFVKFWRESDFIRSGMGRYHVVFVFFVALMFGISLASLYGYHCYLVLHNRTTLEAFRAPMFRSGTDKNGFSIGTFNNFKEVFGSNPRLWFLPVFTSLGDGCEFPVRSEHRLQSFTTPQETRGYESMGTTRSSVGDGMTYPQLHPDEDTESLLSSERWGDRARHDEYQDGSSVDDMFL